MFAERVASPSIMDVPFFNLRPPGERVLSKEAKSGSGGLLGVKRNLLLLLSWYLIQSMYRVGASIHVS